VEEDNHQGDEFDDHEGSMAKSDLLAIHKQAGELYNMMGENDQLEGWVQAKITKAADYINAVYNNMQYEKTKPTSVGDGMGSPADTSLELNEEDYDTYRDLYLTGGDPRDYGLPSYNPYPDRHRRPLQSPRRQSGPITPQAALPPDQQKAQRDALLGQTVKYIDVDGTEREATVKSLLSYSKEHPGRRIAARMYAQLMSRIRPK
jgi:hypothetical protein